MKWKGLSFDWSWFGLMMEYLIELGLKNKRTLDYYLRTHLNYNKETIQVLAKKWPNNHTYKSLK